MRRRGRHFGLGSLLALVATVAPAAAAGPTGPLEVPPLLLEAPEPAETVVHLTPWLRAGDGFWDETRALAHQTNTLVELGLELAATLHWGPWRLGAVLPVLDRRIDQTTPGTQDAVARGLGDAVLSLAWDRPVSDTWSWGLEGRWFVPTGRAELSLEDVNRGSAALAPLGTGGHTLEFWLPVRLRWHDGLLTAAGGYAYRTRVHATWIWNGNLAAGTTPYDRLLYRLGVRWGVLTAALAGFHEFNRRDLGAQNSVHAHWLELGFAGRQLAGGLVVPLLGRSWPAPPPLQFAEREPLLARTLWWRWSWRW